MLAGDAQAGPLIAEAGHDAAGDHRLQRLCAGFVAYAVEQFAALRALGFGEGLPFAHAIERAHVAVRIAVAGAAGIPCDW